MRQTPYADRLEAGQALARAILDRTQGYGSDELLVLGLARGGVPVAAPVAAALHAPLDVLLVRKLGLPRQPELAMGAIASVAGSIELVRNESVLRMAAVSADEFQEVYLRELGLLGARQTRYRAATGTTPMPVDGRCLFLVDDGLATGTSMRAAIAAVRRHQPARVVVACPVGALQTAQELGDCADDVVVGWLPEDFHAVGQAYLDFSATSDADVCRVLAEASREWGH